MRPFRIVNRVGLFTHYRAKVLGGHVWTSSREKAEVYTVMPSPGTWDVEFLEPEKARQHEVDLVLR